MSCNRLISEIMAFKVCYYMELMNLVEELCLWCCITAHLYFDCDALGKTEVKSHC